MTTAPPVAAAITGQLSDLAESPADAVDTVGLAVLDMGRSQSLYAWCRRPQWGQRMVRPRSAGGIFSLVPQLQSIIW